MVDLASIEEAEASLLGLCHFYPGLCGNDQSETCDGAWRAYSQLKALYRYFGLEDALFTPSEIDKRGPFRISQKGLISARLSFCQDSAMRAFIQSEEVVSRSSDDAVARTKGGIQSPPGPLQMLKNTIEHHHSERQRIFVCGVWNKLEARGGLLKGSLTKTELYRSPWSGRYQLPLTFLEDFRSRMREPTLRSEVEDETHAIDAHVEQFLRKVDVSSFSSILECQFNEILVKYVNVHTPLLELCGANIPASSSTEKHPRLGATAFVREVVMDYLPCLEPWDVEASLVSARVDLEVVVVSLCEQLPASPSSEIVQRFATGHVFHLSWDSSSGEDAIAIRHEFGVSAWRQASAVPQTTTLQLYHQCAFLADMKPASTFRRIPRAEEPAKTRVDNAAQWSSGTLSASLIAHYLMERLRSVENAIKTRVIGPCIQCTVREIRRQTSNLVSKPVEEACAAVSKEKTNDGISAPSE